LVHSQSTNQQRHELNEDLAFSWLRAQFLRSRDPHRLRRIAAADRRNERTEHVFRIVTRPEGILLGITIVFFGMLAAVVMFATVLIMAIRLSNLRHTSNGAGTMLEERRRVVLPSLVIIGVTAAFWVILLALDIWWNIVPGFPLERVFRALH
jgi:predicted DNA repair protein MutK